MGFGTALAGLDFGAGKELCLYTMPVPVRGLAPIEGELGAESRAGEGAFALDDVGGWSALGREP